MTTTDIGIFIREIARLELYSHEEIRRMIASVMREVLAHNAAIPSNDSGIEGAVPLPAPDWFPPSLDADTIDWHEQNKRINDLLMRGKLV